MIAGWPGFNSHHRGITLEPVIYECFKFLRGRKRCYGCSSSERTNSININGRADLIESMAGAARPPSILHIAEACPFFPSEGHPLERVSMLSLGENLSQSQQDSHSSSIILYT